MGSLRQSRAVCRDPQDYVGIEQQSQNLPAFESRLIDQAGEFSFGFVMIELLHGVPRPVKLICVEFIER